MNIIPHFYHNVVDKHDRIHIGLPLVAYPLRSDNAISMIAHTPVPTCELGPGGLVPCHFPQKAKVSFFSENLETLYCTFAKQTCL